MPKYANQKTIKIQKEPCDKKHPYAMINIAAGNAAACILKGESFKLWWYLAQNQDEYSFDLSPADIQSEVGIIRRSYNNALNELIEQGFLEPTSTGYVFHEKLIEEE